MNQSCGEECPDLRLCRFFGWHMSVPIVERWFGRGVPEGVAANLRALWLRQAGKTAADVPEDLRAGPIADLSRGSPVPGPKEKPRPRSRCIHQGEPTGETRDCKTCGGGKNIPLLACALHGVCTSDRVLTDVAWCRTCKDHAPAAHEAAFDRVYLINLKERTDRLETFRSLQKERGWRLPDPIVFPAIRGDTVGVPKSFTQGGGAFGCRQSHIRILEDCLMDGVGSVLIFEDDVEWQATAWDALERFLRDVPPDWDQLMLGGQHEARPVDVAPGVQQVRKAGRTHAYAVRGKAMKSLLNLWYETTVHIDWSMMAWQRDWKVYAPDPFLFGQGPGRSDILGRVNMAPRYWTPPPADHLVIVLDAPREAVEGLRGKGFHTGFDRDRKTGRDAGLEKIGRMAWGRPSEDAARSAAMRKWINDLAWECASMPGSVVTVWHPGVPADLVRSVHPRTVEITAATVEEAVAKREAVG